MLNVRRNISLVKHNKTGNMYSAEYTKDPKMFSVPLLMSDINWFICPLIGGSMDSSYGH
jgi:hypothetical protein